MITIMLKGPNSYAISPSILAHGCYNFHLILIKTTGAYVKQTLKVQICDLHRLFPR